MVWIGNIMLQRNNEGEKIETGKVQLEIYFIEKIFRNKLYEEIRSLTFKIARFFVDKLLDEGFSFSYIRFDKYQTCVV
jgi:hypothetical protein